MRRLGKGGKFKQVSKQRNGRIKTREKEARMNWRAARGRERIKSREIK